MIWILLTVALLVLVIIGEIESRPPVLDTTLPPPISDEEFVRRLSPEVPPEVGIKVRAILAEKLALDKSQIYPETCLADLIPDDFDCWRT